MSSIHQQYSFVCHANTSTRTLIYNENIVVAVHRHLKLSKWMFVVDYYFRFVRCALIFFFKFSLPAERGKKGKKGGKFSATWHAHLPSCKLKLFGGKNEKY